MEEQRTPVDRKTFKDGLNQAKTKKQGSTLGGIIVIVVFIAIIVGVVMAVTGGAKAKYQASSNGIAVISSKEISVGFRVTNTGKKSGTPNCSIEATNPPQNTNIGTTIITASSPIAPGQTQTSAATMTVNNQGAATITKAVISW